LIEILADPGGGGGTFQAVSSDKIISFLADEMVNSTGILCQMGTESVTGSLGTNSESDMTIPPEVCGIAPFAIEYEVNSSNLILTYPYIGPCREKYDLR
jgi:hypothetical protein